MATPLERFMNKVETTDGCWTWQAGTTAKGYGVFKLEGRAREAYRVAYEFLRGPVPNGFVLDHLCRNRLCVNPDHLEPVTRGENFRRGDNAQRSKTHCPQGHPYDVLNTRHWRPADGVLRRGCKTCHRDRERDRRGTERIKL